MSVDTRYNLTAIIGKINIHTAKIELPVKSVLFLCLLIAIAGLAPNKVKADTNTFHCVRITEDGKCKVEDQENTCGPDKSPFSWPGYSYYAPGTNFNPCKPADTPGTCKAVISADGKVLIDPPPGPGHTADEYGLCSPVCIGLRSACTVGNTTHPRMCCGWTPTNSDTTCPIEGPSAGNCCIVDGYLDRGSPDNCCSGQADDNSRCISCKGIDLSVSSSEECCSGCATGATGAMFCKEWTECCEGEGKIVTDPNECCSYPNVDVLPDGSIICQAYDPLPTLTTAPTPPESEESEPGFNIGNFFNFTFGEGWSVSTELGDIPVGDYTKVIQTVINIGLGVAGGVAVLLLAFGGYTLMFSQGDPYKIKEGKEVITAAIAGLIFVTASITLVKLIGGNIFNLFTP